MKRLNENPDVIVIGAGMGGLVSAGILASQGLRVCILEKETMAGGYVTGFQRKGFYFDATGAFVSSCGPGGEFSDILMALGVADQITFLPIDQIWNIYPDFDLRFSFSNLEDMIAAIKGRFPEFSDPLDLYGSLTMDVGKEFILFEKAPTWKKALLPVFFPKLFRYARKTHSEVLGRFFHSNAKMTLTLSTLPTTLPPSKLSYLFVAILWEKALKGGVYYPKGGMKALSNALLSSVLRHKGQIICEKEVSQLLTQGRKVVGVRLLDGTSFFARWVIADINLFRGDMLLPRPQTIYGKMHRTQKYQPSLSAVIFYIAMPQKGLPPDWTYFISLHTGQDDEAMALALNKGSMDQGLHIIITTPTLLDPSLAPSGYHSLKILVHAPPAPLFKKRYGRPDRLKRLQDRVFSLIRQHTGLDIQSHALFTEMATPMTLQRRTGNEKGAMYGLDAAVGQVGPQRPPNRTRLENLLWVGHYTRPAHGIVGSAMSGRFAAEIISKARGV